VRAHLWRIALYRSETWIIEDAEIGILKVFRFWCYRRMMRISWVDRVRNEEVLRRT
jgi:hypothetical protein